jgi:glycosyltransferase involved in cell wall biosynthesis
VPADAYLVGIVAANYGTKVYDRKGFGDMAHAMALLMEQRPDAYLYLHTLLETADGFNLPRLLEYKGVPTDRVRFADQYAIKKQAIDDSMMAGIYTSFDVLLATSRGEGFGIPVIEAQACGTPVIASNWTAQAELVGDVWTQSRGLGSYRTPSGWLVRVDPDYDWRQGADFGKPQIGPILVALNEAYERRGDPELKAAAIAKADGWRADVVFETYWKPILDEMAVLAKPAVVTRQQRRAAARRKLRVVA